MFAGLMIVIAAIAAIQEINTGFPGSTSSLLRSEPHYKILINGNAQMDAFFAGNLTQDGLSWSTAYIMKDFEVDAMGIGSAIRIWNTTRYLVITNCSVNNSRNQHDGGIELNNCININITNCHVYNNERGLYLERANQCHVIQNNISGNLYGVMTYLSNDTVFVLNNFTLNTIGLEIGYSTRNNVTFNNFSHNDGNGVTLSYSNDCLVENNVLLNNTDAGIYSFWGVSNRIFSNNLTQLLNEAGIYLYGSRGCTLTNNLMAGTGILVEALLPAYLNTHSIDTSNKVNGKNVYYMVNQANITPAQLTNAGQIVLVNCTNASIYGMDISNSSVGLCMVYCNFGNVTGNNFTHNRIGFILANFGQNNSITSNNASYNLQFGMESYASSNNTFVNNTISNNDNAGLVLRYSSTTLLDSNNVSSNMYGIVLENTNQYNTLYRNDIHENQYGCFVDAWSPYNTIYLNRFGGNTVFQAYSQNQTTMWDNNTAGNYWSDYTVRYPAAPNNNNTWGTPYQVSGTMPGFDRYPLVHAFLFDLLPRADFAANVTSIIAGQRVQFWFTGMEGRGPATYEWNFGDGSGNQTERDPSHKFTSVQNCTVTLTINDAQGRASTYFISDYIKVETDLLPSATFNQDRTYIIAGQSIRFNFTGNPGNLPSTLTWDFGDSSPVSHATNPSHQYSTPGNFTVSLAVIDRNGNSSTISVPSLIDVGVEITPVASFITNGSAIVVGQRVQFIFMGDLGNLPSTIEWSFGDGTANSTQVQPLHQFSASGNFTIRVRIVDWDGDAVLLTRSSCIQVQANTVPIARFTVNSTLLVEGQFAMFMFTGEEGNYNATFQWDFGDGTPVSTVRNPLHRYVSPGNYNVSLIVRDYNGDIASNISASIILVEMDLVPSASFVPSATTIVQGSSVNFTYTGSGGNLPVTISWNFNDGSPASSELNPNHQFTAPGAYYVTLTVFDRDGSRDVHTVIITVSSGGNGGDSFLILIILLVMLGSVVGIIVPFGYKRIRSRTGRIEAARMASPRTSLNRMQIAAEVTVFSVELLQTINQLGIDEDFKDEILSVLKNVPPKERRGVLDAMLKETRDFNDDF